MARNPRPGDFLKFHDLLPGYPTTGWTGKLALPKLLNRRRTQLFLRATGHTDFTALCSAIGFVGVNWALMEQSLDHSVHSIWNNVPGAKGISNEVPRTSYSRKSEYLTKAVTRIPLLHSYRDEVTRILSISDRLAEKRNDITHSVIESLHPVKGEYLMTTFDVKKNVRQIRHTTFKAREFPKLSLELVRLGRDVGALARKLITQFGY
ncbi:MAG TPA: hypothetical protein VK642_08450 [Burkholderiales bacterium]|nr:hypothetical protein [Burkholderiales bacterium]